MKKEQCGHILVTVVLCLTITLILGTGILAKSVQSYQFSQKNANQVQAYMAARSILDGVLYFLENNSESSKIVNNQANAIEFIDGDGGIWNCEIVTKQKQNIVELIVIATSPDGKISDRITAIVENLGVSTMKDNLIYARGGVNFKSIDYVGSEIKNGKYHDGELDIWGESELLANGYHIKVLPRNNTVSLNEFKDEIENTSLIENFSREELNDIFKRKEKEIAQAINSIFRVGEQPFDINSNQVIYASDLYRQNEIYKKNTDGGWDIVKAIDDSGTYFYRGGTSSSEIIIDTSEPCTLYTYSTKPLVIKNGSNIKTLDINLSNYNKNTLLINFNNLNDLKINSLNIVNNNTTQLNIEAKDDIQIDNVSINANNTVDININKNKNNAIIYIANLNVFTPNVLDIDIDNAKSVMLSRANLHTNNTINIDMPDDLREVEILDVIISTSNMIDLDFETKDVAKLKDVSIYTNNGLNMEVDGNKIDISNMAIYCKGNIEIEIDSPSASDTLFDTNIYGNWIKIEVEDEQWNAATTTPQYKFKYYK